VHPDDLGLLGEAFRRRRGAAYPLGLGGHGHEVAVIAVAGAVLVGRKKPL
jgi:hypothetical protein